MLTQDIFCESLSTHHAAKRSAAYSGGSRKISNLYFDLDQHFIYRLGQYLTLTPQSVYKIVHPKLFLYYEHL